MILAKIISLHYHSSNWKSNCIRSDFASPNRGYCFYGSWRLDYGWSKNVTKTHSSNWRELYDL